MSKARSEAASSTLGFLNSTCEIRAQGQNLLAGVCWFAQRSVGLADATPNSDSTRCEQAVVRWNVRIQLERFVNSRIPFFGERVPIAVVAQHIIFQRAHIIVRVERQIFSRLFVAGDFFDRIYSQHNFIDGKARHVPNNRASKRGACALRKKEWSSASHRAVSRQAPPVLLPREG